jgi:hypothetical protein
MKHVPYQVIMWLASAIHLALHQPPTLYELYDGAGVVLCCAYVKQNNG